MITIFRNEFDLPLNVLLWLTLATFVPSIFFALYADAGASYSRAAFLK